MPRKEYIEEYVWHWMECMLTGQCLVTEKCRRMVISWTARMLELYQMGFGRCDQILVGEDLASAAKHVYRLKFIYEDLQSRYKDWHLPAHRELQYEGEKRLKLFALPNGSMCSYANGQSEGLQGDGVAIITMEEFGIYRNPSGMLFQAKAITMGSARAVGGFVNVITNASENKEWQRVKKPASISKGRTGIGGRDLVERGEIPLPETLR